MPATRPNPRAGRRPVRLTLATAVLAAGAWAALTAQSQNPFGQPSTATPQPAADIKAVPGSRAQGWLSQGRIGGGRPPRHRRHQRSAGGAGRARHPAPGRQRHRRRRGHRRHARRHLAERHRHRRGPVRHRLGGAREEALRAARPRAGRPPGGRRSSSPSWAQKRVPGSGVNAATVPGAIAGYDALLTRFGTMGFKETFEPAARAAEQGWGLAERRHSDLLDSVKGLAADSGFRRHVPRRRQRAGALQHHQESQPGQGAAADPGAGQGRLLQGRHRQGHRRQGAGQPGRDVARRPGRVPARVGRAGHHQLSRLRHLPAAAARAGLCRARDAEHPRGVRAEAGVQPGHARPVGPDEVAPDGGGQEAGLRRPAGQERRPEVQPGAGAATPLQGVRGHAVRQDRSEQGAPRRPCPAAPTAAPST